MQSMKASYGKCSKYYFYESVYTNNVDHKD